MKERVRRITALLLNVCLLFELLPANVLAEEATATGSFEATGGKVYYEKDDTAQSVTITDCDMTVTAVEIPDTIENLSVTKIAGDAFTRLNDEEEAQIISVSIPASVKEIEAGAFYDCQHLTTVIFEEGCQPTFTEEYVGIYTGAFEGCTSLETITLPVGTKALAQNMFYNCEKLKSVNLNELSLLTEIPDCAFACTALEKVELPANVITVGESAFARCVSQPDEDGNTHESILSVSLNDGLQTIGGNAFSYSGITELTLPNSVTTLESDLFGGSAFSNCNNLTSIKWPENNPNFTTVAGFEGCNALPNTIFSTFPVSVTSLGYRAFANCDFTEIVLPNTIEEIGERAFINNSELKAVTLPDSLEKIGESAFDGCGSLIDVMVTIPENVTYIGAYAFQYDSWPYGGNVDLKILNPDISLKDENGDFIQIFNPLRDSIIRGYRYNSNGGDSDVYAYALDAAAKIAEYDDEYACTFIPLKETQSYSVSGTVKPSTAEISVVSGGVSQSIAADENGVFSFTVTNDEDVAVTFSADGYFEQTFVRAAGSTENWELGTVELAELPVSRTITVSLSDSEGKSIYGFDGLELTLKAGENILAENTDYTMQFPYIILNKDVPVTKDSTLTLTATVVDESLQRSGATAVTTLNQPRMELVLPVWGNAVIPTVSSFAGGHNVLIFDSEGKLEEYGTVASTIANETYSYTTGRLKAGSYTAVIFNQNKYISVTPALSDLISLGMTENTDYKKVTFTVRDEETTTTAAYVIPILDTSKLGTIADTDFSCIRLDENSPLTGVKFRARVYYGFADEAAASGTLTINIPTDATVSYVGNEIGKLEEGATSNGYTKSDNVLTIPVSRNKGIIIMDLTISGVGNRCISASLSDGDNTSPIGGCTFDCYTTRLTLPSEYFENRMSAITAAVKAKPQTAVDMYLDGEKKGTVITDKLGIAYFDFYPPENAAIGQRLTVSTRTAEGDGADAIIKNYPTDAIVKEFFFTQYHYKYYVVSDSKLTTNLSYNYVFRDSYRDECKDISFSATINAKYPLDVELTSVTVTMKDGGVTEVPMCLNSQTLCADGSTDYIFTGMITLQHPGVAPQFFDNSRVPVRLDLNYANELTDDMKSDWDKIGQSNTQNLMAGLVANTELSDDEEKEIDDKYENPWTEEFLEEYSKNLTEDFCQYYYYSIYCADPENPTDEEKAKAWSAAQADVSKILEPMTTTDQDEIDDMIDMLFLDEYMPEFEDDVFSNATEEEKKQLYEFESTMLSMRNSIDSFCDYISAGLLLDKNLTDYADGIEVAEEMGITLSPELAAKAEDGTLEDYMKTVSVKAEQEENSDIVYAYDQNGTMLYSIDTGKYFDKVLANKDIINSGSIESALHGGNAGGAAAFAMLAAQDDEGDVWDSLALARDELEAVTSFGGNYWLGLGGTLAQGAPVVAQMFDCYDDFIARAPKMINLYEKYIIKYLSGNAPYMTAETYRSLLDKMTSMQFKLEAVTKIPPVLEKAGKVLEKAGNVIGKAGDMANAVQVGNDVIDAYAINSEIENWEDEEKRHEKLFRHYLNLELKDCEEFPTRYDCTAAHRQCMSEARTLQRLYKKLQKYAVVDGCIAGGTLVSSFVPGFGTVTSLTIATGGYLYGAVADDEKAQLQADITAHELAFKKAERAAKKYCRIEREDCKDDNSEASDGTGKGSGTASSSGNTVRGQGSIGSDLRECLDPSGIVYEAVESNPLYGATAELWYSANENGTNAVKWDAENYGGQINPQITDKDGMYSWYVPDGWWQVRVTKAGYIAAQTDWMEVPPPRFDVNIGLVSMETPAVQSINAYPDYVEIIFTQYMSVTETLTVPLGYTCEWVEETPVNAESSTYYSKVLHLVPTVKSEVGDTVLVSLSGAKNYAGKLLPEYSSGSLTVIPRPDKLVLNYEEQISVQMGESPTPRLTVRVLDSEGKPISGLNVTAAAFSDLYASVLPVNSVTGEDGIAVFSVEGKLPGTTKLNISVDNTSLSMSIPLIVTNTENRPKRPTAQLGDIALTELSPKENFVTVGYGETMTLSCETDGAVIYYTTDGTCPCQNTAGRMKYTGPVTITENTRFRIAAYKEGMDYSERLNITVTVDDTHRHDYDSEWKSDKNSHWHECSCGTVSDMAEHDWKVENAKDATATELGYTGDKICKVCGYTVKGEEIPTTGADNNNNNQKPSINTDDNKTDNPTDNSVNSGEGKPTKPEEQGNTGANTTSPKTGDSSNMLLWIAVLFVTGADIFGAKLFNKRRKYTE